MNSLDSAKIKELRNRILAWGKINRVAYPWRQSDDRYSILVAEFMLHRTQAIQAQKVYSVFIKQYPTLERVGAGNIQEIRKVLQPLGLGWRIDAMINALLFLWRTFGCVPDDTVHLLSVPGIGPYIAGATVCFSKNIPLALIDTNTVRVIGRVFGFDITGEARRRKEIVNAIDESCDPNNPRNYYYALIDLAHSICKIKQPVCKICPLFNLPCHYSASSL